MAEYRRKGLETLKDEVSNEFGRIERMHLRQFKVIRDDQEIYDAGKNIIDNEIKALRNATGMWVKDGEWGVKDGKAVFIRSGYLYIDEALQYFKNARKRLDKSWSDAVKKHGNIRITKPRENIKQIKDIATDIKDAQKKALQKVVDIRIRQKQQVSSNYSRGIGENGKPKLSADGKKVVLQEPLFKQNQKDGTLTFTSRVNKLNINQALGTLHKNHSTYKIDYTNCTNAAIKQKIRGIIGGYSCWIVYSNQFKTYLLTDKNGKILNNKALVYDGVTVKCDKLIEIQANLGETKKLTPEENSTLNRVRSDSKSIGFDDNDYDYFRQYRELHGKKTYVCSAYAFGVVTEILAKQGYCFAATEVNAWQIANSSNIIGKFDVRSFGNRPQQEIVNAPAGSFLTVRYEHTTATESGVSHVMVSLGNGVYTDLFGSNIRKIDFKSEVKFDRGKFTYRGSSYILTPDACLITPKLERLNKGLEKTIDGDNLTPEEFTERIHASTGINKNYIRTLIIRQNNINLKDFNKRYTHLAVDITVKDVDTDIGINYYGIGHNDVTIDYLQAIGSAKSEIMEHYPGLTSYEYNEIAKRANNILKQETKAGRSKKYIAKEAAHSVRKDYKDNQNNYQNQTYGIYGGGGIIGGAVAAGAMDYVEQKKGEYSRGYTQIKYNTTFGTKERDFLKRFGINGGEDLTNAKKCGIATMVALIDKYYTYVFPMRNDSFRLKTAYVIEVKFGNGKKEFIAKGRKIKSLGRTRTDLEIEDEIKKWADKNKGVASRRTIVRPPFTEDEFFDCLYYTRNNPKEIEYGTVVPREAGSIAQRYNRHDLRRSA